jgi:hypothetical protein
MISSEEFHQKLQAGRLHEALALVVRDATLVHSGFANELDVTTRLTEDLASSEPSNREYLRTKINLLTGDIQNEVGKDVVTTSSSYLKLQKLHIDQIIASHRIVQGYLDRVTAILTTLAPAIQDDANQEPSYSTIEARRLDTDSLVARLTESTATVATESLDSPKATLRERQVESVADNEPKFSDEELAQLAISGNTDRIQGQAVANPAVATHSEPPPDLLSVSPVDLELMDDDIDLSIDEDGAVWEEWVEDDDFMSELPSLDSPASKSPSALSPPTLPDREEHWIDPRQLHPIELKPTLPRISKPVATPSATWDKFEPEYIDALDCQPLQIDRADAARIDRLLSLDN